jgi:methyl-accepting chemotaxis protein
MATASKFGIAAKIWALIGLMVVGLVVMTVAGLSSMHQTMLEDRRQMLKQVVDSATSIVTHYQDRAAKGELSEEEAKARASEALRAWRYGKNDYVFINSYTNTSIMHPLRPEMQGMDQSNMQDPNGVYVTRSMTEVALKDGLGYVNYMWARTKDAPPSPKISYVVNFKPWSWIVGSGMYVDDVDEVFRAQAWKSGFGAILLVLLVAVPCGIVAHGVTKALGSLVERMRGLADGDTSIAILGTERGDEVGDLARAMAVFKESAQQNRRLLDEQEAMKLHAAADRRQALLQMAHGLESRMSSMVAAMSGMGKRLHTASGAMIETARQTTDEASAVVAATEQTSANVQTVATATEELNSSGGEIGRQVTLSAEIARSAAREAEQTNIMVGGLSTAAARIGEVVRLIDEIASQTNLLALNATIEAARAGEAGKGFAVVASEVKTLATQTARATQEISAQIASVQTETNNAVAAIQRIGATIARVDEATSSIAGAVEQQNAAIQEISRSVQEAAHGTAEVAAHITKVADGARVSQTVADDVAVSAHDMVDQTSTLAHEVEGFLAEIRASAG